MSRRKLDQIRPVSGRKMDIRTEVQSGRPDWIKLVYIYTSRKIFRRGKFSEEDVRTLSSVRISIFRPLPGRICPKFLLDICRSSCVDHPCKISANLVIVKDLKIDLVYRRSEICPKLTYNGKTQV